MKPLFWIWKWPVMPYSLLMALGFLVSLAFFIWSGKRRWGIEKALDAFIWSMFGGVMLGRAGFVVINWEYFSESPGEAWQFWRGGLAFPFALAGGLLALALFARLQRLNLAELLDIASLSLAPAQAFGWWACYAAGFAYGKEWKGFPALFLPDVYGVKAYRFPVQLAGAFWSALIFAFLLAIYLKACKTGSVFLIYAFGYLPFDFSLRFFRGDVTRILGPLELGQLVLAFVLGFSLTLYFTFPRSSSKL
ncbi:MAG: prolipoprotein diacylglyceryl transferase [Anaerolineae bacterium]|nr:prolipoprotein diacylglyceryl transferase [Anaerolineae bacterium]MDW8101899.1 prolipoprotein diacylglyceryl transferase [Anaerolineae bacterium]